MSAGLGTLCADLCSKLKVLGLGRQGFNMNFQFDLWSSVRLEDVPPRLLYLSLQHPIWVDLKIERRFRNRVIHEAATSPTSQPDITGF